MKAVKCNSQSIHDKVNDAYTKLTLGEKDNIVEKFIGEAYRSDILFYPEATINGKNFYGLFKAPDIF